MPNTKKKIAILGANEAITMLIDKAKSLGYETHVFAWQCGDPGEKAADYFYPISLADKESILEKCKELGVCGICSITSDFASPVVNYVARNMGFPCNPEKAETLARNKYEMRRAIERSSWGGYSPKCKRVNGTFAIDDTKDFTYPLIVKPTDRWSSKGITRVDKKEGLEAAVKLAVEESLEDKAIIEEFIEGPEYSAECIVQNGKCHVLTFTKKETTGFPRYIETGHVQPSDISADKQDEIKKKITAAVLSLGIENSAAHAEFRIMKDGNICIMEIGARMGGDSIGTDLTPISTGMDFIKMVIDVAVGNKLGFDVVTKPRSAKIKFIISREDMEEYRRTLKATPERIYRAGEIDENFNQEVVDSSTRHGYYILLD